MDLVSCRNLLIYMGPELQKKTVPMLHYALKPNGFLFLGPSESASGFEDVFEVVDRKHRIFLPKTNCKPPPHRYWRHTYWHENRPCGSSICERAWWTESDCA